MSQAPITVIGGVNIDISATLTVPFVAADSNPGAVTMGGGGVGRNIAHNLCLLGEEVSFVTTFGDDNFGNMCLDACRKLGMELSMAEQCEGQRNGVYLCVNNMEGEMLAAVVDNDIANRVTPEWLDRRINTINRSVAIVADTNLSTDALTFLIDNCTAPLFVDTVSTAKAPRVIEALRKSDSHRLHTLKLNLLEAQAVTGLDSVEQAAASLVSEGVGHVYVTLGERGVLCASSRETRHFDALPVDVVNTTGAGDAFVAGLVHAFANGVNFPQCAIIALKAARAALMTNKTVNPRIAEIINDEI